MRAIGLAVLGVALAWLVVSTSLAAFLAGASPRAALWLSPGEPQALLNLAEAQLGSADGASLDQIRSRAETALANDPLNAGALRILGRIADAEGDKSRAAALMQAAARRWVHESTAMLWLMRHHGERKDYAAALHYADILLRTRTQALPDVVPLLGRMAEDPAAASELEKLLAANPPWRRAFFSALPRAVTDARTPLRLLLAVRDTPDAPKLADIRGYVGLLMDHGFYELAYYAWLQFLPPDQLAGAGSVFNGGFERAPSGLPFDWSLAGGAGASVEILERPVEGDQAAAEAGDQGGGRVLRVTLGPGRVELGGVSQTLLLAPGAYRLKARYRGEIAGPRGLVWRVSCAGSSSVIGQSAMMIGAAPAWKEIEARFSVPPPAECRAQQLRLILDARSPSEQLVSGSAWIDAVSIAREE